MFCVSNFHFLDVLFFVPVFVYMVDCKCVLMFNGVHLYICVSLCADTVCVCACMRVCACVCVCVCVRACV